MTKRTEPIPFVGMVEIDDDEVSDTHPMTRKEFADELGITRTAVGQTENRALKKFKEKFLSKFRKDDFI
jgi:DNA-directed RNA polymerase sigma subunit (sigma70/sigma32)